MMSYWVLFSRPLECAFTPNNQHIPQMSTF